MKTMLTGLTAAAVALAAGCAFAATPPPPPPNDMRNQPPPPRHECKVLGVRGKTVTLSCDRTDGLMRGAQAELSARPPRNAPPPPPPPRQGAKR